MPDSQGSGREISVPYLPQLSPPAEDYGSRREWSLSLSCPEAAGILLRRRNGLKLHEYVLETGEEEPFLSSLLKQER